MINPGTILIGAPAVGAASAFTAPFYGAISKILDAKILPGIYKAMSNTRTLLPGPDAAWQVYMRGQCSWSDLVKFLTFHNITAGVQNDPPEAAGYAAWWQESLLAQVPRLELPQMAVAYNCGFISKEDWQKHGVQYKWKGDQLDILYKLAYAKFDLNIILAHYFRGYWDYAETKKRIRAFVGCNDYHADSLLKTTNFIPPPTDLIRFAVRDVYNPEVRQRDNLEDEFTENKEMRQWFAAQGIKPVTIKDENGNWITRDTALDYWVAHWNLPSPTQGYEFLHRFRPGRVNRYTKEVPELKQFMFSDLSSLLKQEDYAPKWRPYLAASSYSLPNIRDVRNMFKKDVIDLQEVKEKLQDRGYSNADTEEIAKYWDLQKKDDKDKEDERKHAKAYGRIRAAAIAAYKQGSIARENAKLLLLSTRIEPDDAEMILTAIDIEIDTTKVQSYIKMVKGEFFLGLYDGLEAYTQLVQGGVNAIRSNQLVQLWNRQLSRPRRVASSEKLIQWYGNGWMSETDLVMRLEKLGWSNPDVILYMSEAQLRLNQNKAKAIAAQAKTEKERAAAARQLMVQARSDQLAQIQAFTRHSSWSDMKNWYKLGYIDKDTIFQRLTGFMGWSIEDAQRQVATLNGATANET